MRETLVAGVTVPEDVLAFAREQQVDGYLPAIVEAARRNFPGTTLGLRVEEHFYSPEIRQILVDVKGVRLSVEETIAAKDDFHHTLFALMPAPQVCLFCLMPEMAG